MTRMCRAQYEQDDVIEAEIICHGRRRDPTDLQDPEAQELINGVQDNVPRNNIPRPSRMSVFTWRLPAWVNFSYSTMNQRGHRPQHRRPNPFGPHKDKDLTEAVQVRPRVEDAHKPEQREEETAVNEIKTTPNGYPWNMPVSNPKNDPAIMNTNINTLSMTGPVVRHPPPLPWDDQATIDLPYDNPFYTRTIDNILWLPRNPAGILDLDDTVDLKVAIPVEAAAGRLGTWLGLGETESPDEQYDSTPGGASSEYIPKSPGMPPTPLPEVDGTEEIDLPLVIAKRVQAKESDVESTLRPRKSSLFLRKPSGDKGSSIGPSSPLPSSMRRPTVTERPNFASFRSFSAEAPSTRARSSSTLPISRPTIARARSPADQELGVRPDAHAQADFVAANPSASRVSLSVPKLSRTQNVSAAQAIFHEVLEEERRALNDRLEEETAEATKSQSTKSWLTSWMFKKTE